MKFTYYWQIIAIYRVYTQVTVKALGSFILLMKSCLPLNDLLEKVMWRTLEQLKDNWFAKF